MGQTVILIRGAGDLASGIAHRLVQANFSVVMLETPNPTVIRRKVSFAEAVFEGEALVEGVSARLVHSTEDIAAILDTGKVAVLVDPQGASISKIKPRGVVDAIMAKRNLGTRMDMAPVVVGIGPGFVAGRDVHAVIETQRGHYLGKIYLTGEAVSDTGIPGEVGGYTTERLLRAPAEGKIVNLKSIGDSVRAGEEIAWVGEYPVKSLLDGVLRGLIRPETYVYPGMKIGDVDPRAAREHCFTISDKARAVAGGVLEALLHFAPLSL
ncbi:MAG: selenium-dependent molybdenum cofactor biosynthesis protein YqeB [Bacillota bacterium]